MGSSFENILIEAAEPEALRRGLIRALKPAGFVPSGEGEGADCAFRLYGSEGNRFWTLVGESFGGDVREFTTRLARSLKRRAIVAWCVDSDALMLSLTKGGAFSTVCVGDPTGYDIEPGPYHAAPWKELVGEEWWAAFRAAVDAQYICAEDALLPLASLVGFRFENSVRYFDDPGKPLMECIFMRKAVIPEYIPDDQPPAFRSSGLRMEQGALLPSFASAGGQGTGAVVCLVANGFCADECSIPSVRFARAFYHFRERHDIEIEPKRVRFDDGRESWMAAFPDAQILPGANPEHPKAHSVEGLERAGHREYFVIFSMRGGWSAKAGADGASGGLPALDVHLIPAQNRAGGAMWRVSLNRPAKG